MHLIERYSLSTGLKIDNPTIAALYYPVCAEKYVVFHTSAKDNLRDYDYWNEVMIMLKPLFAKHGLKTVQIGLEKDPSVNCDIDFRGKTSMNQMAYVIKNCDYFIGVDSFPAHLAGFYNKKMLSIYANSYAACVYPYWGDRERKKVIETHRPNGEKPSFSFSENPKTINRLKPDEISKHFCDLLDPLYKHSIATVHHIGAQYTAEQVEVVPDHPYAIQHPNLYVRMDMFHDEQNFVHALNVCPASVIIKKPFDKKLLQPSKIKYINYVSDEFDKDFVDEVKRKGIEMNLICTDESKLNQERAKFFDFKILPFSEEKKIQENKEKVSAEIAQSSRIASRKKVLKNKQQYNSHYEANNCENINDLFLDLEWIMLYSDGIKD